MNEGMVQAFRDLKEALEVFVAEGRPHSHLCDCAECHLWENCKKLLADYKRDEHSA